MEKKFLLTIYVLSYNSSEKTGRLLDSLLPFNFNEICVVIADNSDTDDSFLVTESRKAAFNGNLRYVKNVCNIGFTGNALRAFELIDSQFVWIVGCGDRFLANALDIVKNVLNKSQMHFIALPVNGVKIGDWPKEQKVYNNFIDALLDLELGPLTNIHNVIYPIEASQTFLPLAYEAGSSLVPHTAILAAAIREKHGLQLHYFPFQVMERLPRPQAWDVRKLWSNLSTIYPEIEDEKEWKIVRSVVIKTHSDWVIHTLREKKLPVTKFFLTKNFGQFGVKPFAFYKKLIVLYLEQNYFLFSLLKKFWRVIINSLLRIRSCIIFLLRRR